MRFLLMRSAMLSLGFVSVADAAVAIGHAQMSTSRYIAIETCTQQAQAQFPATGAPMTDGRNRSFAYAACMRSKDFAP
jgi:hypothetical protein